MKKNLTYTGSITWYLLDRWFCWTEFGETYPPEFQSPGQWNRLFISSLKLEDLASFQLKVLRYLARSEDLVFYVNCALNDNFVSFLVWRWTTGELVSKNLCRFLQIKLIRQETGNPSHRLLFTTRQSTNFDITGLGLLLCFYRCTTTTFLTNFMRFVWKSSRITCFLPSLPSSSSIPAIASSTPSSFAASWNEFHSWIRKNGTK